MRGAELLSAAELHGARPEVLRVLGGLPEGPFANLRSLWAHLPEVPRGT